MTTQIKRGQVTKTIISPIDTHVRYINRMLMVLFGCIILTPLISQYDAALIFSIIALLLVSGVWLMVDSISVINRDAKSSLGILEINGHRWALAPILDTLELIGNKIKLQNLVLPDLEEVYDPLAKSLGQLGMLEDKIVAQSLFEILETAMLGLLAHAKDLEDTVHYQRLHISIEHGGPDSSTTMNELAGMIAALGVGPN